MNLNETMIIFDSYEMPTIWTCTKRKPKEIVLSRRDKCECGGDMGVVMSEEGHYNEFCLVCKKEFK